VQDASRVEIERGAIGLWRSRNVLPFLTYAVTLSLVTGILTQVFVFAVMDKLQIPPDEPERAAIYTGPAFMVGAMAVMMAQLVLIPYLKLKNKTLMITGCIPLLIGALILIPAQDFATLILAQFFWALVKGSRGQVFPAEPP